MRLIPPRRVRPKRGMPSSSRRARWRRRSRRWPPRSRSSTPVGWRRASFTPSAGDVGRRHGRRPSPACAIRARGGSAVAAARRRRRGDGGCTDGARRGRRRCRAVRLGTDRGIRLLVGGRYTGRRLALDSLAAAVYAGRAGVSARRLARLPLARAARHLAYVVDACRRACGPPAAGALDERRRAPATFRPRIDGARPHRSRRGAARGGDRARRARTGDRWRRGVAGRPPLAPMPVASSCWSVRG